MKCPIVTLRADEHATVHWLANHSVWNSYTRMYDPMLPDQCLYARGNLALLNNPRCIAIVGTRYPTKNGEEIARHLGARITQEGLTHASGMAFGCDQFGHDGALTTGNTIAVLGSGLHSRYVRDVEFAKRILWAGGLLITPYDEGEGNGQRWKHRNAIIALMSGLTIPVQTANKGGTINEMNHAKKFCRPIWFPRPDEKEKKHTKYEAYREHMRIHTSEPVVGRRFASFDPYDTDDIATLIDTAEREIQGYILPSIEQHSKHVITEVIP